MAADLSGAVLDLEEDDDLEVFTQNTSLAIDRTLPTSPSSMTNQYHPDPQDPEESLAERDLFITVDNPESHLTAVETFIMYRVLTRTSREDFDSSEVEVHRRYQEFSWLRSRLEESHPTLILPPLPEKFVMKGMVERFNEDFIETRKRGLHQFLQKISIHPVLSHSPHLKVFLTAQDLAAHRKQGPGLFSWLGDTVRSMGHSVRGLKSRAEEFSSIQDYVERFSTSMASVDRVTQRIVREHREYLDELKQSSSVYSQWAELEPGGLAETLAGMARSVEACGEETELQVQGLSQILLPVLHQYVLYADSLKAVLRRRDMIQADFEMKNEALAARKADPGSEEEVDALANRLEQANVAFRQDWSRWKKGLASDVRAAFVSTAERNQQYYEKCAAVWESFLLAQRTPDMEPSVHPAPGP